MNKKLNASELRLILSDTCRSINIVLCPKDELLTNSIKS